MVDVLRTSSATSPAWPAVRRRALRLQWPGLSRRALQLRYPALGRWALRPRWPVLNRRWGLEPESPRRARSELSFLGDGQSREPHGESSNPGAVGLGSFLVLAC